MPFVVDASVSAVWALTDESNPVADLILENWTNEPLKKETALVPSVWWYELRNVLVINERRRRLTALESKAFLRILASFPIQVDEHRDEEAILGFARKYQLSFYDAAYLELAQRHGVPLATLDKSLRAAAEAAGIPLFA
jgi:predicted nucleic acid-binding protein